MSKLVQRLERVGKASPPPMGFGAARQPTPPSMLLVASCSSPQQAKDAVEAGADALLLAFDPPEGDLKGLNTREGDTPWGTGAGPERAEDMARLGEGGCDFVVVEADKAFVDTLDTKEMGRVLLLSNKIEEHQAAVLEYLPVDAVLLSAPYAPPLTLEKLMALAGLRAQVSVPFLLPLEGVPSPWEMECLRDIGVEAVVLSLDQVDKDGLAQVRYAIDKLPRAKPKGERPATVLPRVSPTLAAPHVEEEEEEPEEP